MERICGPMNKNRIEGAADPGERTTNREALVTKGKRRKSGGRCSEGVRSYLGRSCEGDALEMVSDVRIGGTVRKG